MLIGMRKRCILLVLKRHCTNFVVVTIFNEFHLNIFTAFNISLLHFEKKFTFYILCNFYFFKDFFLKKNDTVIKMFNSLILLLYARINVSIKNYLYDLPIQHKFLKYFKNIFYKDFLERLK